jgi:NADH-quinone oxidoreductase subunit E
VTIDPLQVRRYAHGSRVPGWDESNDLTKDPAVVPDPATTPVPAHIRMAIEAQMAKYPDIRSAAIPALKVVQAEHGWCSPTAIEQAACVMRLTPAYLTAVATFYDMFEMQPAGEFDIYVCTNISCSLLGADDIYATMKAVMGADARFKVRAFECLGACDIAPMASVNGEYVGPLEPEDCKRIVADLHAGGEILVDKQLRRRKVADPGAPSGDVETASTWEPRDDEPHTDSAGLPPEGETEDRAGGPAPIELNQQHEDGGEEEDDS